MNKVYRGWVFDLVKDDYIKDEPVYKAKKGREIIMGTEKAIKMMINERAASELRCKSEI